MPNIRTFLWVALGAILFLNYEAWQHDYAPPEVAATADSGTAPTAGSAASKSGSALADTVPAAASAAAAAAPLGASPPVAAAPATPTTLAAAGSAANEAGAASNITVKTDVLDLKINLKGGELDQADLLKYPLHKDDPNVPVRLFSDGNDASLYVLQTGLTGETGEAAPNHLTTWTAAADSYVLQPGQTELRVPLTWSDGHGLTVTKTYVFKPGWYAIDLDYDVHNAGSETRKFAAYSQILRHWEPAKRSYFDVETYSFKGPAVYNGKKAMDLKVDNAEDSKYSESVTNGWIASLQHHFVAAVVPTPDQPFHIQLQVKDKDY